MCILLHILRLFRALHYKKEGCPHGYPLSLNEFKKYSKLWFLSVLSQAAALVAALVARAAVALVASVVVALVAAALA